jgi:replicative DNA helicase
MGNIYLPHSIETERAVLGACMNKGLCPTLDPSDFYQTSHQLIVQSLREMDQARMPIEMVTVYDFLSTSGRLESVGGGAYLARLAEMVTSARNLDAYEKSVRERAIARRLLQLCQKALHQSEKLVGNDVMTRVAELQREFNAVLENSGTHLEPLTVGLKKVIKQVEIRMKSGGGLLGVPTGLTDLDKVISGLVPGDLIVIAARPSMGKTALATTMALNAAKRGHSILFFSLEMPNEQLLLRKVAQHTGVNLQHLRTGSLGEIEWAEALAGMETIYDLPIWIDDRSGMTVLDICHQVRKVKPVLVFIDYLQLLRPAKREERRDLEIAAITLALKGLAKDLKIPVVLLCQLNRQVENRGIKKPMLSDLRESGAIEQDADVVLFPYREEVYEPKPNNANVAEIIIAKHRNGETGSVRVTFLKHCTSFRNAWKHGA